MKTNIQESTIHEQIQNSILWINISCLGQSSWALVVVAFKAIYAVIVKLNCQKFAEQNYKSLKTHFFPTKKNVVNEYSW